MFGVFVNFHWIRFLLAQLIQSYSDLLNRTLQICVIRQCVQPTAKSYDCSSSIELMTTMILSPLCIWRLYKDACIYHMLEMTTFFSRKQALDDVTSFPGKISLISIYKCTCINKYSAYNHAYICTTSVKKSFLGFRIHQFCIKMPY